MRKTWVLITVGAIAVVGAIVIAFATAGPSDDGRVAAPKPQPQSLGRPAAAAKAQTRAPQHEAAPTPGNDPGTETETGLLLRYRFARHDTFTVRLKSTVELIRLPPNETRPRAADGGPTAASSFADEREQTLWELDQRVIQIYPDGSARLEVTFRRLRSAVRVRERTGDGHIETRYDSAAPSGQRLHAERIAPAGHVTPVQSPSPPSQIRLLGSVWNYRLGPMGKISAIARIQAGSTKHLGHSRQSGAAGFSARRLGLMLTAMWPPLPPEPLREGQARELSVTRADPLLGSLKQQRTFTLTLVQLQEAPARKAIVQLALRAPAQELKLPLQVLARLPRRGLGGPVSRRVGESKARLRGRLVSYQSVVNEHAGNNSLVFRADSRGNWRLATFQIALEAEISLEFDGHTARRLVRATVDVRHAP